MVEKMECKEIVLNTRLLRVFLAVVLGFFYTDNSSSIGL